MPAPTRSSISGIGNTLAAVQHQLQQPGRQRPHLCSADLSTDQTASVECLGAGEQRQRYRRRRTVGARFRMPATPRRSRSSTMAATDDISRAATATTRWSPGQRTRPRDLHRRHRVPIAANLTAGTVSGAGVGNDTLISVERIRGTSFADTYVATGWAATEPAAPCLRLFNEFEGMDGDDTITGNGPRSAMAAPRISYLQRPCGDGRPSPGRRLATLPSATTPSPALRSFAARTSAIRCAAATTPSMCRDVRRPRRRRLIDGRGGLDRANYDSDTDDNVTGGITVNLAAGTVTGDASIGTDTLRSIESVRGTDFADTYDATGFAGYRSDQFRARTAPSTNSKAWAATTPSSATATPGSVHQRLRRRYRRSGGRHGDGDARSATTPSRHQPGARYELRRHLSAATMRRSPKVRRARGNDSSTAARLRQAPAYARPGHDGRHRVNMAAGMVTGDATVGTDTLTRSSWSAAPPSPTPSLRPATAVQPGRRQAMATSSNYVRRRGRQRHITGNGNTRFLSLVRPPA